MNLGNKLNKIALLPLILLASNAFSYPLTKSQFDLPDEKPTSFYTIFGQSHKELANVANYTQIKTPDPEDKSKVLTKNVLKQNINLFDDVYAVELFSINDGEVVTFVKAQKGQLMNCINDMFYAQNVIETVLSGAKPKAVEGKTSSYVHYDIKNDPTINKIVVSCYQTENGPIQFVMQAVIPKSSINNSPNNINNVSNSNASNNQPEKEAPKRRESYIQR